MQQCKHGGVKKWCDVCHPHLRKNDDTGQRKWHPIFGWCVVTKPYTDGGYTLIDSKHKHIQHFIIGRGWVDYIGTGQDGNIVSIHVHKSELYDFKPTGTAYSIIQKHLVKIIK